MSQQFGCASFPFRQDLKRLALARTTDVNSTISSAIRCYLLTSPGERRGNNVGSFLSTLKHTLIPDNSLSGIADSLKKDLTAQFPGVTFSQVTLQKVISQSSGSSDLIITLAFQTTASITLTSLTLTV